MKVGTLIEVHCGLNLLYFIYYDFLLDKEKMVLQVALSWHTKKKVAKKASYFAFPYAVVHSTLFLCTAL